MFSQIWRNADALASRKYRCWRVWHGRCLQKWWTHSVSVHDDCAGHRLCPFTTHPGMLNMQYSDASNGSPAVIWYVSFSFFGLQLNCSRKMRDTQEKASSENHPDFAETVELCVSNGPPKIRKWASLIRVVVNIFICVTQIGFCCVYFVFISTNFKQVCSEIVFFFQQ